MKPGNNYTEIKELRSIQDELMDCICRADDILRRNAGLDEIQLIWRAINEKQASVDERLRAYREAFTKCWLARTALEDREDKLQLECFSLLEMDVEDADATKAHLIGANRRMTGWMKRNLEALKGAFSRERLSA